MATHNIMEKAIMLGAAKGVPLDAEYLLSESQKIAAGISAAVSGYTGADQALLVCILRIAAESMEAALPDSGRELAAELKKIFGCALVSVRKEVRDGQE